MWEQITKNGRIALNDAYDQALRLGHSLITPEHVLRALTEAPNCGPGRIDTPHLSEQVASLILRRLDVPLELLSAQLLERMPPADERVPEEFHLSPGSIAMLEAATEEALALGGRFVGTEHMLLGILRDADGEATRILQAVGVTPDRVRAEIRLIGEG
jgi:ATP-dependent Clp protease ATP-binding subunit ClpC